MTQETYRVKNWEHFQHYKDRNPPWIKLHFELLSSEAWVVSDEATRNLMIVCMLIASRNDGKVPSNADYLKRVGYLKRRPNFKALLHIGFLEKLLADASTMQADARPETETYREETETETEDTHAKRVRVLDPPGNEEVLITDFQKIYDAGCAVFPLLATANTSSIHQWIAAGCSAELDVIPEIQRLARADKAVRAWSYFSGGVMDAMAKRTTPLPQGRANGYGQKPAESDEEWFERKKKQYGMREEQA